MSRANQWYREVFWAALAPVLLSVGCSAQSGAGGGVGKTVPKSDGGASGAGGVAGRTWTGGSGGGSAGSTVWNISDASIPDGACQGLSAEAEQIEVQVPTEVQVEVTTPNPVAIYIMLDKTLSMTMGTGGATKWQTAVTALNTFVNDPQSGNIYVALQYYCTDNYANDCAGSTYTTPEVPMGELPGNAAAISASLAATVNSGFTPTEPALRGVTQFCIDFQQDPVNNPEKLKCVAVLVTDGEPNVCAIDGATLSQIAADAYNNGVMTFTVGFEGANFTLLDQIAQAGNGDCTPDPADTSWACNVSGTGGTTFIQALNSIRGAVTTLKTETQMQTVWTATKLPCEWSIPEPPKGRAFDRDMVNVQFSSTGDIKDIQTFGRVDSSDKCGTLGNAWHYDDLNQPTKIVACPNTCDVIKAAELAKISILFGCETVIALS